VGAAGARPYGVICPIWVCPRGPVSGDISALSVRTGTAGVILRMFSCMKTPDTTRVWRFVRAGGASPDPANVVRRAQSFAVAASESGTVTLVCVRDERGMAGYLVTSDGSSAD